MLKVDGIDVFYGNIHALKGVSLEVNKGEIVTLIGANGAGKTTLLKTISGLLKPKNGDIVYEGARSPARRRRRSSSKAFPTCRKGGACSPI
ncbi:High-affinity branched-chain amino acid transport ATP-binding protein LivF [Geobacillus sp. BCO2]|nr:High-affinity branched-chain amino acid transport ATP-binding protein LivF [Geobacillus sp. BCO2]